LSRLHQNRGAGREFAPHRSAPSSDAVGSTTRSRPRVGPSVITETPQMTPPARSTRLNFSVSEKQTAFPMSGAWPSNQLGVFAFQ
jgi:hypothetical protein